METKVIESKQFELNWRDLGRGLITALIGAVMPLFESAYYLWFESGEFIIDWNNVWKSAVGAGIAYLILNFSSKGKIITIPQSNLDVTPTAKNIKRVV